MHRLTKSRLYPQWHFLFIFEMDSGEKSFFSSVLHAHVYRPTTDAAITFHASKKTFSHYSLILRLFSYPLACLIRLKAGNFVLSYMRKIIIWQMVMIAVFFNISFSEVMVLVGLSTHIFLISFMHWIWEKNINAVLLADGFFLLRVFQCRGLGLSSTTVYLLACMCLFPVLVGFMRVSQWVFFSMYELCKWLKRFILKWLKAASVQNRELPTYQRHYIQIISVFCA